MLKRQRRVYHGRVAAWLAGLSSARANDFLGLAAEHFERAGEHRRAAEFYARAAEHAAARHANDAVVDFTTRALALLADERDADALRWRLCAVRERAFDLQGRRVEHQAAVDALTRLADALDDDRLRADAAKRRSYLAMRRGDKPAQIDAARAAMAFAERAGAVELQLRALNPMKDTGDAMNKAGDAVKDATKKP